MWDQGFESAFLQRRVCEPSVPQGAPAAERMHGIGARVLSEAQRNSQISLSPLAQDVHLKPLLGGEKDARNQAPAQSHLRGAPRGRCRR
jgi:hypothetical protein